ncbi:hypothetical protein QTP88_017895 [Uroleucon formosanum]
MDICNENDNVSNITLEKLAGLFVSFNYWIRDPSHFLPEILSTTVPPHSSGNRYAIVMCVVAMVYLSLVVCTIDMERRLPLWRRMELPAVTRYDFTSLELRNRHVLNLWRERSVWITNTVTFTYLTSLVFFGGSSRIFRDDTLTVENHGGSVGNYRQNLSNFYLILTDETYKEHYDKFYIVELLALV